LKEAGKSTLGALKVWMDEVSGRLNLEGRGQLLGGFDTGDNLLVLNYDGTYELEELDMTCRYDPKQVFYIGKHHDDMIVSAVYYEGERGLTLVKRFEIETSATGQKFNFITDHRQSKLYLATVHPKPEVETSYKVKRETQSKIVQLAEFIDVKGWKSLGNKLHDGKLVGVKELNEAYVPPVREVRVKPKSMDTPGIKPGSTIELDF
jgi:topoisomerase-4 subunit A